MCDWLRNQIAAPHVRRINCCPNKCLLTHCLNLCCHNICNNTSLFPKTYPVFTTLLWGHFWRELNQDIPCKKKGGARCGQSPLLCFLRPDAISLPIELIRDAQSITTGPPSVPINGGLTVSIVTIPYFVAQYAHMHGGWLFG